MHTPEVGGFMIGLDHLPAIGTKLRLPQEENIPDDRDGWYLVEDVIQGIPDGRIDVYARRITVPADLSYSAVRSADYNDKLKDMIPYD
jgi:hypothetical protein